MKHHTPTTPYILDLARQARLAHPSKALDTLILNVALGSRCCWAGSDLLVESLSTPGKVYTVTPDSCDCRATRPCWHARLRELLDPPGDNPMGDDEGDSLPARSLGARLAIARAVLGVL